MDPRKTFRCCLCGETSTGWGNNPWPCAIKYKPKDGEEPRCCDMCNSTKVIGARLRRMALASNGVEE